MKYLYDGQFKELHMYNCWNCELNKIFYRLPFLFERMNDTEPRHSLLGIYQAFMAQNEQSKPLKEKKKLIFSSQ